MELLNGMYRLRRKGGHEGWIERDDVMRVTLPGLTGFPIQPQHVTELASFTIIVNYITTTACHDYPYLCRTPKCSRPQ